MKIEKNRFLYFLNRGFSKYDYELSQKQMDFIFKKAEQLIDLINEMESFGFLKDLNQEEIDQINTNFDISSFNIGEIGKMTTSFIDMIKNSGNQKGTEFILRDSNNNEYRRSAHQIATFIGMAYASLCEFNRVWLSQLIDFNKIGKTPSGIGNLIGILREKKITKLDFFDHIDTQVRNSFFHLNFRFDGMKVYCDNASKKDYIELPELLTLAINMDRSGLTIMYACLYYVNEYKKKDSLS